MAPSPRHGVLAVACLAIFALVLGLLPTASEVAAKDAKQVAAELRETGHALDAANKRVSRAMRAWNRASAALPKARGELRDARKGEQRAAAAAQVAEAKTQEARAALEANRARQALTMERRDEVQGQMDSVARTLYQRGPFGEIEVVLSASSPGDFALRLAAVDSIGRSQASVEAELARIQGDLVMQEVEQEALKVEAEKQQGIAQRALDEAQEARQRAANAKVRVESLVAKRQAAAQRAKRERSSVQARYQALRAEQARIQRAAARAARAEAARRASTATPSGMVNPQGELRWPIEGGRISGHVGPRTHPVFGYASCHTGLDVAAPSGTAVRAAADGTVALITSGGPYGNAVLVAHGDGLTTFYAHLSSVAVNEGQQVNTGDLIGGVGSTGWSTGPHLHFETRVNGKAYDPMGWFGKSRSPVGC